MKQILNFFMLWLILLLPFNVSYASIQNDPVTLLKYIADHMIDGLKTNKANLKNKPDVVFKLAYKYVVPYADLGLMSKSVLSPQVWNKASEQEKKEFQKEFTTTVIRTYASALSSYEDQNIQFYPIRGEYKGSSSVTVNSQIESSQNASIQVSYRLVHKDNQWRLFDLSVEGVSLIESFRSQFSDILAEGNMTDLLNKMGVHNQGRQS